MADKKFQGIRKRYAPDGSPTAASEYIYLIDGQEVSVEVHATVTNQWNVSKDDVKRAAEHLLEADRGEVRFVLDDVSVKPIAEKLGWKPR